MKQLLAKANWGHVADGLDSFSHIAFMLAGTFIGVWAGLDQPEAFQQDVVYWTAWFFLGTAVALLILSFLLARKHDKQEPAEAV